MAEKLRILHVHTFYEQYLQSFYAKHHELREATHAACMRAIFLDGFSAVHLSALYLPQCDSRLIISNDPHSQSAWAWEHGVPLCADWESRVLREQILDFRPDVLYLVNPLRYDARFLRSLPFTPRLIMGWRAADVPLGTDWTGYDVMLSALPRMLALATSLGAKAGELFYPGMPDWIAKAVENTPKDTDVVFVGSISPTQHIHRLRLLNTVAEAALDKGFTLALHLSCGRETLPPAMQHFWRPPVFGLAMHRALARGRIVVDDRAYHGVILPDGSRRMDLGGEDTANMRLWEGAGGGSLVLTEHLGGLEKIFSIGKEVATYTSHEDCVEKIEYYLTHENERLRIAAQGKARCLGQWNIKNAAEDLYAIIKKHL